MSEDAGDRDASSPSTMERAGDILLATYGRVRAANRSPRTDRLVLAAAGATFVVLTVIAIRRLPVLPTPTWGALVLAAVLALATLAVNTWEYLVIGHALGQAGTWTGAGKVTVLAAFANLLPIPGAVVMKTRGLQRDGTTVTRALPVVVAAGGIWVSVASVLGAAFLVPSRPAVAAALAGLALAGFAISATLVRRARVHRPRSTFARITTVEVVSVAVTSLRIYAVMWGLGSRPPPLQAVALTVAAIISSAVGLVPGGLGLREVLSAGVAALVDLDPAIGLVVSALDRVILAAMTALVALAIGVSSGRPAPPPATAADRTRRRPDTTPTGPREVPNGDS